MPPGRRVRRPTPEAGAGRLGTGPVHGPRPAKAVLPGVVRIIGGAWKRSKLPVADRPGLRPTPDRVRETLFNWLGQNLSGWRCLDPFAGSGALGFEAASRGAAEVVLLERDRLLCARLNQTRERLKATQLRVETADAIAWMARCEPSRFDLVLLDPPFEAQIFEPALAGAARVVAPGGWVYLEADRAFDAAELLRHGLTVQRQGRAGAVHFHLLRRIAVEGMEPG